MSATSPRRWRKVGVKTLKATYDFAIHTHGSIGPSCAVAEFKDGKLTSWSASQATHDLRKQLATMFGMPVENVRCIYLEGSGCYGRNGHEDAAADAALLAKAVGRPVRVQWSRADEHGWDPEGPADADRPARRDGRAGNVTAWESEFFIPQQTAGGFHGAAGGRDAGRHAGRRPHRARQHLPELGHPVQIRQREDGLPPPGDDAVPSVLDPHAGADAEHLCQRVLHRRAGGGGRGRSDRVPLEISRSRTTSAASRCSTALAALAKWDKRPSPQATARAATSSPAAVSPTCKYELVRTYVAAVAEVEVNRSTGDDPGAQVLRRA